MLYKGKVFLPLEITFYLSLDLNLLTFKYINYKQVNLINLGLLHSEYEN